MLILLLAFLTGCFAGPFSYDYYDYPEVAYNNINNNVLRKPPQIGRAKLDNDYVGLGEQGDRMSVGVSPTLDGPLLRGMDGPVEGGVGRNELNNGLGGASGFRDELGGGIRSKSRLASDYVGGLGGGFSGSELNDGSSLRGGGGSFGGGNSANGDSIVGGDSLGGVADYTGADYAEADAQDYIDMDKQGTSGFLGISEQMGGGFKPIQHQSLLKMSRQIPDQSVRMKQTSDDAEFGDDYADYADYADEEIPANNKLSYLGLLDGLHIQEAGPDHGQDYADYDDYADDYAVEQFPADPARSFMGLLGGRKK